MPQLKEVVFQDFPISFRAHPVTGNLTLLKNADAIKQSVINLVRTNFYERPYAPYLGGNVAEQLFENASTITEYSLTQNIRRVLENYEPRALIDDVIVQSNPDGNSLTATIIFRIKNNVDPFTVDVFLTRVR
jgi:phage baseplate assembly protein W